MTSYLTDAGTITASVSCASTFQANRQSGFVCRVSVAPIDPAKVDTYDKSVCSPAAVDFFE